MGRRRWGMELGMGGGWGNGIREGGKLHDCGAVEFRIEKLGRKVV